MDDSKLSPARIESDDGELFRREIGAVRPVRGERVPPTRPARSARARHSEASERAVMDELAREPLDWSSAETGEELMFLRSGLQRRVLKRLRRGQYAVGAELDLHQMNTAAARASILDFLDQSRKRRINCVKIIHGKGLRSRREGPVLKRLTDSLLRRRKEVLAFASARPNDGGTGAVYVLLRGH